MQSRDRTARRNDTAVMAWKRCLRGCSCDPMPGRIAELERYQTNPDNRTSDSHILLDIGIHNMERVLINAYL